MYGTPDGFRHMASEVLRMDFRSVLVTCILSVQGMFPLYATTFD